MTAATDALAVAKMTVEDAARTYAQDTTRATRLAAARELLAAYRTAVTAGQVEAAAHAADVLAALHVPHLLAEAEGTHVLDLGYPVVDQHVPVYDQTVDTVGTPGLVEP